MDVCAECETGGQAELLSCTGGCHRRFHVECIGETGDLAESWRCPECLVGVHRCFACKRYSNDSETIVCMHPSCGCRFHNTSECRARGVIATGGVCGRHHCHECTSTSDAPLMQCTRCVKSYHPLCVAVDAHIISASAFYCVSHVIEGGSAHGVDMAAASAGARKRARTVRDADTSTSLIERSAMPRDGAASHGAKRITTIKDIAAAQLKAHRLRAQEEAAAAIEAAAAAHQADVKSRASAPFSLVAALSQAKATAEAAGVSGGGARQMAVPGRGRGAELAAMRLNPTSAMTWDPPPSSTSYPQPPGHHWSGDPMQIGGHATWSGGGAAGGYPSYSSPDVAYGHGPAGSAPGWHGAAGGVHATGDRAWWPSSVAEPPALDLQATEELDDLGRQIFVDAAGSGEWLALCPSFLLTEPAMTAAPLQVAHLYSMPRLVRPSRSCSSTPSWRRRHRHCRMEATHRATQSIGSSRRSLSIRSGLVMAPLTEDKLHQVNQKTTTGWNRGRYSSSSSSSSYLTLLHKHEAVPPSSRWMLRSFWTRDASRPSTRAFAVACAVGAAPASQNLRSTCQGIALMPPLERVLAPLPPLMSFGPHILVRRPRWRWGFKGLGQFRPLTLQVYLTFRGRLSAVAGILLRSRCELRSLSPMSRPGSSLGLDAESFSAIRVVTSGCLVGFAHRHANAPSCMRIFEIFVCKFKLVKMARGSKPVL